MRERALLIGGRLSVAAQEAGGTEVRLTVPPVAGVSVPLRTRVLVADDHRVVGAV